MHIRTDGLTPAAPLAAPAERIVLLDILRGLALFGMILVHFHQKMRIPATGLEGVIGWATWILVEQKAWGIFAFLFGVGFAVLLRRLETRGAAIIPVYLRRLAVLAVFGLIADVFFGFRILLDYAFWGVALLLIRRWSTRALLVTAALAVCAQMLIAEAMAVHAWWTAAPRTPGTGASLYRAAQEAAQQESYQVLLAARWALFVDWLPRTWRALVPDTNLVLFILGLLALRHGVLEDPRRHVRLITGVMIAGALSFGAAWLMLMVVQPRLPQLPVPNMEWPLLMGFGFLRDQWLCLTYIGGITLLLAYHPQWTARLAIFGHAGRMALTNYMLQVAVLDALASGYGFGLKLRPVAYLAAAIALFAVEAALSRVWLARYRYGPLEWLWRSLTYMRLEPLRRQPSAPVQTVPA